MNYLHVSLLTQTDLIGWTERKNRSNLIGIPLTQDNHNIPQFFQWITSCLVLISPRNTIMHVWEISPTKINSNHIDSSQYLLRISSCITRSKAITPATSRKGKILHLWSNAKNSKEIWGNLINMMAFCVSRVAHRFKILQEMQGLWDKIWRGILKRSWSNSFKKTTSYFRKCKI